MNNEFTNYGYYGAPRWNDFSIDDEIRAKKRFSRFFLAIFIYLIIANASAVIIQLLLTLALGAEAASKLFSSYFFVWGSQMVCMYLLALPAFYLIVRGMRKTIRSKSKLSASEFLIYFLIGQGLMTIGSFIATILTNFYSSIFNYELSNTVSDMISDSPIWMITLVAVIIGPIVEEFIFRKLLMDKLGMYGDRIAIIVSAVAFGLFHGNLFQLFYAGLFGALLAYVYSKTGNLLYPIVLHMLTNLFGSVIALPFVKFSEELLVMSEAVLEGAEVDMLRYSRLTIAVGAYSLVQYGLAIAGIVTLIRYIRRRRFFVSDRCEVLIPKEKRISIIIGNVGAILLMIMIGLTMVLSLLPQIPVVDIPAEQTTPGISGDALLSMLFRRFNL